MVILFGSVNENGFLNSRERCFGAAANCFLESTKIAHKLNQNKKACFSEFFSGYFLGYNLIGSFLISLFIPVMTLGIFNALIWRRLQHIWQNRTRLGVKEKRNTKACLSLIMVVVLFFFCHSMKLVVSGYQVGGHPDSQKCVFYTSWARAKYVLSSCLARTQVMPRMFKKRASGIYDIKFNPHSYKAVPVLILSTRVF